MSTALGPGVFVITGDHVAEWHTRLWLFQVMRFADRTKHWLSMFGDPRDDELRQRGERLQWRQMQARNKLSIRNRRYAR